MKRPCLQRRIGFLFSIWLTFQGCDTGYWVGLRAYLKEPLSPACIEETLHKLPEIDKIAISRPEQGPAQYMFGAGPDRGLIKQFKTQEGRTSFLAGDKGLGTPAEDQVERIQLFNARIAIQVAKACHAKFRDKSGFMCFPDRVPCRKELQKQMSK